MHHKGDVDIELTSPLDHVLGPEYCPDRFCKARSWKTHPISCTHTGIAPTTKAGPPEHLRLCHSVWCCNHIYQVRHVSVAHDIISRFGICVDQENIEYISYIAFSLSNISDISCSHAKFLSLRLGSAVSLLLSALAFLSTTFGTRLQAG